MKTLLPLLVNELAAGRIAALATVVQSSGSVPRGAGACMLATLGGDAHGTVGGGVLEHRAQMELEALLSSDTASASKPLDGSPASTARINGNAAAKAERPNSITAAAPEPVFSTGLPADAPTACACDAALSRLESYALTQNEVQSLGMVCGGHVALLYQLLTPAMLPFYQNLLARVQAGAENLWLACRILHGHVSEMAVLDGRDGRTAAFCGVQGNLCGRLAAWHECAEENALFVEPIRYLTHAYLFGGGHVSQCLAPLLSQLDFYPVVYDDRPAFANRALFPTAADVVCAPFDEAAARLRITAEDEIVIMTRGHANDLATLVQALRTPAYYIGLIGSRSKIAHTKTLALSQGFTEADFARVHTPIGLPIKAKTPMEIAVSVAAEMILCRAERAGQL